MLTRLRFFHASILFIVGYVLVTIVAIALAVSVGSLMQVDYSGKMVLNPAYVFAERFYPLINLLVWIPVSWVYFGRRKGELANYGEARTLGIFWLAFALLVDFVGFVLIENPISLSPYDFYVQQFPWIYLIYLAILLSPIIYARWSSRRRKGTVEAF